MRSLWPAKQSQKATKRAKELPLTLSSRIIAAAYEEDQEQWSKAAREKSLPREYSEYLHAVARGLAATQGDISRLLIVNLGPAWPKSAAILSDNVLEPYNYAFERPPGLGIGSLSLLFTTCKAMHSWLTEAPDTIVVLHTRSCSETGLSLIYLVATCYLLYSTQFRYHAKAFASLEPMRLQHVTTSAGHQLATSRRGLGPAQQRYCSYFERALYDPLPPKLSSNIILRRVVIGAVDTIAPPFLHRPNPPSPTMAGHPGNRSALLRDPSLESIASFLIIYSQGQPQPCNLLSIQGAVTGFEVDKVVKGDVTLGLFLGDHKLEWDPPALAFAFNTNFAGAGVVRLNAGDVDFPRGQVDALSADAAGFFMDLVFDEEALPLNCRGPRGTEEEEGLANLRKGWQQTLKACGSNPEMRSIRDPRLIAEIQAVSMAGATPSILKDALVRPSPNAAPATQRADPTAQEAAHLTSSATNGNADAGSTTLKSDSQAASASFGTKAEQAKARPLLPPPPPPPPLPCKRDHTPGADLNASSQQQSTGNETTAATPKTPPAPPPPPRARGPPPPPPPPTRTKNTSVAPTQEGSSGAVGAPNLDGNPESRAGRANNGIAAAAMLADDLKYEQQQLSAGRLALRAPQFRVLHWVKALRKPGTLWAALPQPVPLTEPFATALEQLFANHVANPAQKARAGPGTANAGQKDAEVVHVISLSRANNVAIMLTRFADMRQPADMVAAILSGSSRLSQDHLALLLQIAPSEDETKALDKWLAQPGNAVARLSRPERFLVGLGKLPRLRQKLASLHFRCQYAGLHSEALEALQHVQDACAQVAGSSRLKQVLHAAMVVGNHVNAGTNYGNAQAIRLDSLLKFASLRANVSTPKAPPSSSTAVGNSEPPSIEPQSSSQPHISNLLELVAWVVLHHTGSPVPAFATSAFLQEELPALSIAARQAQGSLKEVLAAMDTGLEAAETEMADLLRSLRSTAEPAASEAAAEMSGRDEACDADQINEGALRTEITGSDSGLACDSVPKMTLCATTRQAKEVEIGSKQQERGFAELLKTFLLEAKQGHAQLRHAVKQTDACLASTAEIFGEPAAGDSAAMLATLSFFVTNFDQAMRSVCRSIVSK